MQILDWISLVLVVIGALNWGLVGLGTFADVNWNVVQILLGGIANGYAEAAVYLLVGAAGLYQMYFGYELKNS